MNPLGRLSVRAVDVVNRRGKALGVRLVRWTGKRPYPIHPKHLVDHPWHDWYLPYLSSGDLVLDVGCANGAHLARAATRCRAIVGFDYDLASCPSPPAPSASARSTTRASSPGTSPALSRFPTPRSTPRFSSM